MAHKVKCTICGGVFDRDKEDFIETALRRYAHKKCYENPPENPQAQEAKDKFELEQYVMKLFNEPFVNARIKKQIKDFKEEYKYTYSGILKTLKWWYEIKGNSLEASGGGIGIVPYVYKDACAYYYALYLAEIINEDKTEADFMPSQRIIEITSPRVYINPPKLFNLDDEEDN